MDAAGWDTAHLVGSSLGGWTAMELARRGRGRSVVAFSPAGGWPDDPQAMRRIRRFFASARRTTRLTLPIARQALRFSPVRRIALRGSPTLASGDSSPGAGAIG
jgi:pimeloyl-ACP methyl ester carboxylesterase